MNRKREYQTVLETYKEAQEIAGEQAGAYRRSVRLFILSFVAQGLAFVCFFPMMRELFASGDGVKGAWFWLFVMIFMGAVDVTARWFAHSFDYTGNIVDVTHDLRVQLGNKLRLMPLEKLYKYRTGELNSVFSSNVDEAVLHVGVVGSLLLQIIVVPAVVITTAFVTDWRLGLALLVIIPLGIPLYQWRRRASLDEKREVSQAHTDTESDIIEYTQGLPVLRSVNRTGSKSVSLQKSIKKLRRVQTEGLNRASAPMLILGSLVEVGLVVVLVLGCLFVAQGSTAVYIVAALVIATARFAEPITLFINVTAVFDIVQTAFGRIRDVMNIKEPELLHNGHAQNGFDIVFDNVTFAYMGEPQNALEDISMNIPYRSLTALVGPSGSGKTTVTKLIMRYADPRKGSISIGGSDIRSMGQTELMKNISAVFQDVYLFDDTIMNNIRMGRADATDEEVRSAAERAYCHEFISRLTEGYYTKIGDIGGSLSGGERQRISIARAILKNAPIVILDEPTAALDTESEEAVQKAVDHLVKDRTVIVIAHRLSTIKGADKIMVIEDGKLVQSGTHEELVAVSGRYAAMWNAQERSKNWNLGTGAVNV